jgi:hypothetical protein
MYNGGMVGKGSGLSERRKYLMTTRRGFEVISGIKRDLSENIAATVCNFETFRQAGSNEAFCLVEILSTTPHKLNTPPQLEVLPNSYFRNSLTAQSSYLPLLHLTIWSY